MSGGVVAAPGLRLQGLGWHGQPGHQRHTHAGGDHVLDGLQRRALEALADPFGIAGEAREFRAHVQHVVAEAVPGAQQEHGLALEFLGGDGPARRQRMTRADHDRVELDA